MNELIYLEDQSMFIYLIRGVMGLTDDDYNSISRMLSDRLGHKTVAVCADRFVYYAKS